MPDAGVTILCTADIHLGRHPSRVPDDVARSNLSTRSVWERVAREAVERNVDAVVISGDIGDRANQYFEVFGSFEGGLKILEHAEIPTVVVAGNHDAEFLPKIVDDIQADVLQFLGCDGKWERLTLQTATEMDLHIDGWSFPSQHVGSSPLESYALDTPTHGGHLGVLHADLDASDSTHAPVNSADLEAVPVECWVLGHIHAPGKQLVGVPTAFYPGSPQPLDPGEPGPHGPWVLTWKPGNGWNMTHIPLATVRYDPIRVDVSGASTPEDTVPQIAEAVIQAMQEIALPDYLELFLPRVILEGRCTAHGELLERADEFASQLSFTESGVTIEPERVVVQTQPDVDLADLADERGPIGYLAQLILALDQGQGIEEYDTLINNSASQINKAHHASAYGLLRQEGQLDPPDTQETIDVIGHEARRVLDAFMLQKEEQS